MPPSQSNANTSNDSNMSSNSKMSSKSASNNKTKPSYKHVPHSQKPAHLVAKRNARERRRVQAVNQAFYKLRKCVPIENRNKRVSKVKTLQRAIDYIRKLERILAEDDEAAASSRLNDEPVAAAAAAPDRGYQLVGLEQTATGAVQEKFVGLHRAKDDRVTTSNNKQPILNPTIKPTNQVVAKREPKRRGRKPNLSSSKSTTNQEPMHPIECCLGDSEVNQQQQQQQQQQYELQQPASKSLQFSQYQQPQSIHQNHMYLMQCNQQQQHQHHNHPAALYQSAASNESVLRESSACNISSSSPTYPIVHSHQYHHQAHQQQHQDPSSYHQYNSLNGCYSSVPASSDQANHYLACQSNSIVVETPSSSSVAVSLASGGYSSSAYNATGHFYGQPTSIGSGTYPESHCYPIQIPIQQDSDHNWPSSPMQQQQQQQQPLSGGNLVASSGPNKQQPLDSSPSSSSSSSSSSSANTNRADSGDISSTVVCRPAALTSSPPTTIGAGLQQQQQPQQQNRQQVNSSSSYPAYAPQAHLSSVAPSSSSSSSFAVNRPSTAVQANDTAAYLRSSEQELLHHVQTDGIANISSSGSLPAGLESNNDSLAAQVTCTSHHQRHNNNNNNNHHHHQPQQHHQVRHLLDGQSLSANNLRVEQQRQLQYHHNQSSSSSSPFLPLNNQNGGDSSGSSPPSQANQQEEDDEDARATTTNNLIVRRGGRHLIPLARTI